ncbi:MAG: hypothetical protein ACXWDM_08805 [Nocardioides sp.]
MSAELTSTDGRHAASGWVVRDVALVVVGAGLLGAACGALWELWWTPPTGVVLDHGWYPDLEGVRQLFTGTALYTLIALAGGVLLGAVCGWFFDRAELVTMAAVAAGSVLAAWLMFLVGTALAPPDPAAAAATAEDLTELPGTLEVEGVGAFVAFPSGALTGIAVVFIGLAPTRRLHG